MAFGRPLWVVAVSVALASCADWPDDYDITDWSGEPEIDGPVPGEDEEFPTLGSVPEPPENVSTLEDIEQIEQSLSSDLQNAQYTSGNYQRADEEVEFEPVPEPPPEVIEEEEEEADSDDIFGFLDFGVDEEPDDVEEVQTVAVAEEVDVEEVTIVAETAAGDEVVIDEVVVEETVIEEVVVEEPVAEEIVPEEIVVAENVTAGTGGAIETGKSLVAQSERTDENSISPMMDDEASAPSATTVEDVPEPSTSTVEDVSVSSASTAEGTEVAETTVRLGEPEIQVPVGSPDDALPPQAVGRTVATEVAMAPVSSGQVAAEPAVVEEVVAEAATTGAVEPSVSATTTSVEVIERETTVATAGTGGVQETFDALFTESGPDAVSSGSGEATVTASFSDAPSPSLTASGFETLVAIIRFNLGSTALDDNDRRIIQQLAEIHRERGGRIRLVGFASHDPGNKNATDETLVNFKISVDRATAVADERWCVRASPAATSLLMRRATNPSCIWPRARSTRPNSGASKSTSPTDGNGSVGNCRPGHGRRWPAGAAARKPSDDRTAGRVCD